MQEGTAAGVATGGIAPTPTLDEETSEDVVSVEHVADAVIPQIPRTGEITAAGTNRDPASVQLRRTSNQGTPSRERSAPPKPGGHP